MSCSVRVFILALIIDFIIDGFIIGCEGIIISIALLPHEFVHVLGDIVFFLSHDLGKRESVIIRLLCQLLTPIIACIIKFTQETYKEILDKIHIYGHGAIAGMFIYILLIDILPMIQDIPIKNRIHSSSVDITNYNKISQKILLPFFFILCFGTTSALICCKDSFEKLLNQWFESQI